MRTRSVRKLGQEAPLKVVQPVHREPELPMHWYKTFAEYHCRTLGLSFTTLDTCLVFKKCFAGSNSRPRSRGHNLCRHVRFRNERGQVVEGDTK